MENVFCTYLLTHIEKVVNITPNPKQANLADGAGATERAPISLAFHELTTIQYLPALEQAAFTDYLSAADKPALTHKEQVTDMRQQILAVIDRAENNRR